MNMDKIIDSYESLLDEAKYLYQYNPGTFFLNADRYFEKEIDFLGELKKYRDKTK
jgi:hypothetical protein